MLQRKFKLAVNNFKSGTYLVVDVSTDTTWKDVLAHQYHWDNEGKLVSTVNHRDRDFKAACDDLLSLGAIELSPKDWRKGGLC